MSLENTVNRNFSLTEVLDLETANVLPSVTTSDEVIRVVTTVSYGVVCQCINLFGMGTNMINIICFVKQGFKDAVNVSLLALAISDFGCLLTMTWTSLCLFPPFQDLDLPFDPQDMQYLTTALPHVVLTRVTSCITAFITVERCLCVMMPLKVAQLLTPRRAAYIIMSIYVVLILCATPLYMGSSYAMTFSPQRNRTILSLVYHSNRDLLEQISFIINSVLISFTSFLVIIVCMALMVVTLQKQTKWRKSCSSVTSNDTTTLREQKLTKMIVMISVLFVACFIPSVMVFVAMLVVPGFIHGGKFENILAVTYIFVIILESTNSSVNMFIYYSMSSKYRAIFHQIFIEKCSFRYSKNGPV